MLRPIIRPKKGGGSPQGKNIYVKVIKLNQVDVSKWPKRNAGGVVMVGDIVHKDGGYVQEVYATSSSISLPKSSEGDEDSVGFTGVPECTHPGSSLEFEEFIAENTNEPLALAVEIGGCSTGRTYFKIYGSPCNPLSLKIEGQDNNEGVKDVMKFEQSRKASELPGRYYGTLTRAITNVVPADTTAIDVTTGVGEHQLQDNANATVITELTNAVNDGVYTLIGSGGANPATIEVVNAVFQLKADWIGLPQTRITLRAFQKDDGSFVFIEQSRS